jgi:DNA modification methylase
MGLYWKSSDGEIYHGHVKEVLRSMAPESVQMVVTSPPYW